MSRQLVDIEDVLADLKGVMIAGLNTALTTIDTEKNDGITLKPIDDNAYFLQALDGPAANFDPYVQYGVEAPDTTSVGAASSEVWPINVVIVVADSGEDLDLPKRMFRYGKALKRVLQASWVRTKYKSKIRTLQPIAIYFEGRGSFMAVGVSIEVALAE